MNNPTTNPDKAPERVETIVIGAGQAGLATGYYLAKFGRQVVVLDAVERVGDNWRSHWDSLRLYSLAKVCSLPGMPFPASGTSFPTKDQMADFLQAYADTFNLPVRTSQRVRRLSRVGETYLVTTDAQPYVCDNVVVATGTFGRTPYIPPFAGDIDPAIVQLHSNSYKNPKQLLQGPTLVVGASHSGSDIAYELASAGFETVLSGPIHGEIPVDIESPAARIIFPILLLVFKHVLTTRTPIGRRMRPETRAHGGPLIRIKRADLERAGVELVADKTVGVRDGQPVLAGGRVLDVANVVWCTGFRHDFSWIDAPVIGEDGWPVESRGVVPGAPGLYFAGLAFQYAFASMLIGGAGRDAEYVARHIAGRSSAGSPGRQERRQGTPAPAA
jgi:putative flavoprotein involved in K+ transport